MSRTYRRGPEGMKSPERYIYVDAERRDPPDLHKLSRAVIAIALREAQLEADALSSLVSAQESTPENVDPDTGDDSESAA